MGDAVGTAVGGVEGEAEGSTVGDAVGTGVGPAVGKTVGNAVGLNVRYSKNTLVLDCCPNPFAGTTIACCVTLITTLAESSLDIVPGRNSIATVVTAGEPWTDTLIPSSLSAISKRLAAMKSKVYVGLTPMYTIAISVNTLLRNRFFPKELSKL